MRREDDAAGVAAPVLGVERGVVFRKIGSPPLPKIPSTKSRLLTRLAGAKKRVSMVFAGSVSVAGQITGRSRSETKRRACSVWSAVKGSASTSGGRMQSAASSRAAKACLGTPILSAGTGRPPSTIWKMPLVVRRSLLGLCRTPCGDAIGLQIGRGENVGAAAGSDISARQAGAVEHERAGGQARRARADRRGRQSRKS